MTKQSTTPKRQRSRTLNNKTTTGFRISNELWNAFTPLLPKHVNTHRSGGSRPRVLDRACGDAIFYVFRTGYQWKVLLNVLKPPLNSHRTCVWIKAMTFKKYATR